MINQIERIARINAAIQKLVFVVDKPVVNHSAQFDHIQVTFGHWHGIGDCFEMTYNFHSLEAMEKNVNEMWENRAK